MNTRRRELEVSVPVVVQDAVAAWRDAGLLDVRPLWRSIESDLRLPDALNEEEFEIFDDLVAAQMKSIGINSPWRPRR